MACNVDNSHQQGQPHQAPPHQVQHQQVQHEQVQHQVKQQPKPRPFYRSNRTIFDPCFWTGRYQKRHITGCWTTLCLVCNNLQPLSHGDTYGPLPHSDNSNWMVLDGRQPFSSAMKEPALSIHRIHAKNLLEARDVDPQTGKPLRDCCYCRLLCDIFDLFFLNDWMSWSTEARRGRRLEVGLLIRHGSPLVISCSGGFFHDPYVMNPRVDLEMFSVTNRELEMPGVPTMGLTMPRVMDTRNQSCTDFAATRIVKCHSEHAQCKRKVPEFVPSRLLSLGKDEKDIKLVDSPPETARWVALSHCWGNSQAFGLLTSNLDEMRRGIDFADLPVAFQDTIKICRKLSMQWLWIESLCIIQDNHLDWQNQAAQMGLIYQEALLVVVATSSPSADQPFLGPRDKDWSTKALEFDAPSGARVPIMIRKRHLVSPPLDYGDFDPSYTETSAALSRLGPLCSRGGCFQESFLATRALHFTPGAVVFECNTERCSDDSHKIYPLLRISQIEPVPEEIKWRMIIKSYTSRQHTCSSDMLSAVASLASMMPQAARDQYLAGLWRSTLLVDLLWQIIPCWERTNTTMTYPEGEQNLPTWSWASLDHGVLWNHYAAFRPLATVEEAKCFVEGPNPYGAVNGGYVQLTGHLIACKIYQNTHQYAFYIMPDGTKSADYWFVGDGRLVPTGNIDVNPGTFLMRRNSVTREALGGSEGSGFVFCIGTSGFANNNIVGLVLTLSEKYTGCLERVGVIDDLTKDWYDNGLQRTITIV